MFPIQLLQEGQVLIAQGSKWYIEHTTPHHGCMYAIKNYIYSGDTSFQQVDIVDTFVYGRCLILDGNIQSAQFDEHIYHEALVHPAVVFHPSPRRVLVMGGGEGAVLRELCKYPFIKEITMVDLDRQVVELCQRYLPTWHRGSYHDPRVNVIYQDARQYINDNDCQYDLIYSDLTEPDPEGPSYRLFTRQFYELVKRRLAPGGLLILQAGGIALDYLGVHAAIRNSLTPAFGHICSYRAYIPSFNTDWGFIVASCQEGRPEISGEQIDEFLKDIATSLKYYDGQTHRGMFYLPKDVRSALQLNKTVIEDERPLSSY